MALSPANRLRLIAIARSALLEHFASDSADPIPPIDAELAAPAGCFVSLHERSTHRLRGCIGRLDFDRPLSENVRETAVDVLSDPRFANHRVTLGEISNLEIEVSVLSPPREAASPLDFDLQHDGISLQYAGKSGFFLPQVARDTGWTREQLLNRLCTEKLGVPADTWRNPDVKLLKFNVEVVGPEPL